MERLLVFALVAAVPCFFIFTSLGWNDNLRRDCLAQGGQVIEHVSRVQVSCLLPLGMERLVTESP